MGKEESSPSEKEWKIMEVIWSHDLPLTSAQVISLLPVEMSDNPKMIRVLMNRLCQKGILAYTVDEKDARVYHYYALKTRDECRKEKSQRFIDSYFSGNHTGALAAMLQSYTLTEEQIQELEQILETNRKQNGGNRK